MRFLEATLAGNGKKVLFEITSIVFCELSDNKKDSHTKSLIYYGPTSEGNEWYVKETYEELKRKLQLSEYTVLQTCISCGHCPETPCNLPDEDRPTRKSQTLLERGYRCPDWQPYIRRQRTSY